MTLRRDLSPLAVLRSRRSGWKPVRTFPRRTPLPRACYGRMEDEKSALFQRDREREKDASSLFVGATERKKEEREKEREGRTACGVVVVAFEPVRVTEWNGSSVDQRKVGTKGVATTANRARISSERGERAARGTRRRDEADGPTHVRSRGTTLRVRVHATQRCTQRGAARHTYVR